MADYRSPVDMQNAQDFGAGAAFGSVNQLAQLLQRKQLAEQAQQHDANQLLLSNLLKQQAQQQAQQESIKQTEALAQQHPGMGVGVTAEGASIHPSPAMATYDLRAERNRQNLIKNMKADYDKAVGTQPRRLQALQSVQKALEEGNIASLGQLKASLPVLEGENYKPTDKERELMISPTAAGGYAKLKNMMGMGDDIPLSDIQKQAFHGFVSRKLAEEAALADRAKKEVAQRWKGHVRALGPADLEEVEGSLGLSSGELIQHIGQEHEKAGKKSKSAPAPAPAAPSAPTGGAMSFEEFKRKKASGEIK